MIRSLQPVRKKYLLANQVLTRGMSIALLIKPERRLNGRGAHKSAIPLAVLSVYNGKSLRNGSTYSGNSNSSSSSGKGSATCYHTIRNNTAQFFNIQFQNI